MGKPVRVVHYVNQFFAGLGGEEAANRPLEVRREPVGATRGLIAELGDRATVVATIVGGDNYMNDERERARGAVAEALRDLRPDVVIAGPAFEAGRYGLACAEVRLALKVANGETLGSAEVEGYLPRGVRKSGMREAPGFLRALDMLEAKLAGRPFASEIPYQAPEAVAPAPPIVDLRRAEIALVTTGGLVPKGNPDGQTSGNAQKYFRYPIDQLQALRSGEWEAYHVGYFTHLVDKNPNYVLPLGYMRELEKEGMIGAVHRYAYTLPGVSTPVATARRLGEGIAAELREGQVGGCLLVST